METKKYSSYAQIENDLKILKVEKEIHYQKMLLSIDKTKEAILPSKSVSFIGNVYEKTFSGTYATIFKIAIPFILKWFLNKKRGN